MLALLLSALLHLPQGGKAVVPSRFALTRPLPSLPGVLIDTFGTGGGFAQKLAQEKDLQARILWIDATANIDRYNSDEKIAALTHQIRESGFNTVVFDVKPISGQTVYPSKYAPKLTEWKGKTMDAGYDPLATMVKDCHANGLNLIASLNAFSEGHRLFKVGPGYLQTEHQTVIYEPTPLLKIGTSSTALSPSMDKVLVARPAVYSSPERLAAITDGFAVVLKKDRTVSEAYELTPTARPVIAFPKGSIVIAGSGEAATWLREHAKTGETVEFDSEAHYVPMADATQAQIPLMMNPNDEAVQQHALDQVREVVSNYGVDGIIYDDRLRYAGLDADFSENTRGQFERFVGHPITWPNDVFKYTFNPNLSRGIAPGPFFDAWMTWRAERIRDFVARVRTAVKVIRPSAQMGIYAGSWYGEYPALGHNYGSAQTNAGFWFLTPEYAKTSTSSLADFLITGCYYPTGTIYEALEKGVGIGNSVEAAGALSNRLARDETWTYAGISLSDFKDDAPGLLNALQAACASTQGVMVFDLSHDIEPMWPVFARAFAHPAIAPHASIGTLALVRARRHMFDLSGKRDPAVIIASGSAGTGQ